MHSIVANYSGDAGNAASSSAPLSQVINAVPGGRELRRHRPRDAGRWKGILRQTATPSSATAPAIPPMPRSRRRAAKHLCGTRSPVPMPAPCSAPPTRGRIAACWYSPGPVGSSFSVDVNLTDGAAHQVALYLLDWDNTTRVSPGRRARRRHPAGARLADAAVVQRQGCICCGTCRATSCSASPAPAAPMRC